MLMSSEGFADAQPADPVEAPMALQDPPIGGSVTRVLASGLQAALEQFASPEVLAAGKVSIIALDAIVERFGARWPARREQVHAHVQSALVRHLGTQGYHLRISDADVLVCQPDLGRLAGQAACVRYLGELLNHFLGEGHLAELNIHEVLTVSASGVEARRLEARELQPRAPAGRADGPAEEARSFATLQRDPAKPDTAKPDAADRWAPFVAADGQRVRVSCALEPVYELQRYSRIGSRLVRRVLRAGTDAELSRQDLARLSRGDLLRIDVATIARGADRLRAERADQQQPSLIIPVSFISLSNAEGRAEIVNAFKEARGFVACGLICELSDIDDVPASAVLAAVSVIRPFALVVVGRLGRPCADALKLLKHAGLQGLSLESEAHADNAEFVRWAKPLVRSARAVAKSVLVYRTASAKQAAISSVLGATHASMRAA